MAAIVVVLILGVGITWVLWAIGPVILRIIAVAVAAFASVLVTVGGFSRFFEVRERFAYEEPEPSPGTTKTKTKKAS